MIFNVKGTSTRDIAHIKMLSPNIKRVGDNLFINDIDEFYITDFENKDIIVSNSSFDLKYKTLNTIDCDFVCDDYFPLTQLDDLESKSGNLSFTSFGTTSNVVLSNGMRGIQVSNDDLSETGYLQLGSDILNYNNFSVSFWLEYLQGDTLSSIIFNYEGDYELAVDYETRKIKWAVKNNNSNNDGWMWITTDYVLDSMLHHFVYQYNGTSTELWIDNVKVVDYEHKREPFVTDRNNAFTISGRSSRYGASTSYISSLRISEFILSKHSLNSTEINNLWNDGLNNIRVL